MTTRRWLMRFLPAALVPMVAKGQASQSSINIDSTVVVWDPPQWRMPLGADAGKPKNNQCPVCGTVAASWKATIVDLNHCGVEVGLKREECTQTHYKVPEERRIDCARCNCTFLQRAE